MKSILSEKKILLLGASGYLGNKLSNHLQKGGYKIIKCVRNLSCIDLSKEDEYLVADINEIQKYLKENTVDWIINCVVVYEKKETILDKMISANFSFPAQVFSIAVELGIKKFLTIDTSLPRDLNTYSFTKKQFAELGFFLSKKYNISFVNVLLEMFYGEDEPSDRFLVSCCEKMIKGEILLLTDGKQKRDIIYIQDVCLGIEKILNSKISGYLDIPLGTGEAVAVFEIIKYMHEYLNSNSKLLFGAIPIREGEPSCIADMSVLRKLGFENLFMWREGIRHFCDEVRKRVEDGRI